MSKGAKKIFFPRPFLVGVYYYALFIEAPRNQTFGLLPRSFPRNMHIEAQACAQANYVPRTCSCRHFIVVVYHLQNVFGSFEWKISGNNGTSEKVVLFSRTKYSNGNSCSISSNLIIDTISRLSVNERNLCKWYKTPVSKRISQYGIFLTNYPNRDLYGRHGQKARELPKSCL